MLEEEVGSWGNAELAFLKETMAEKSVDNQIVPALVHRDEAEKESVALKAMVSTLPYLLDCTCAQSLAAALHANSS